jgi:hypothetical protein
MKPKLHYNELLVASLERDWQIVGKRTEDIEALAKFRRQARERYYGLATLFFALSIFTWLVANASPPSFKIVNIVTFIIDFILMFFCEFQARTMTRQLHRRAAEQLVRDMLRIRG